MKILKIGIKNLNSLRLQTRIDFMAPPLNLSGLFAITGDTGAGKTTLLDAITLALYKKTPREREDEIMTYGTSDCFSEVEFEVKGKRFRSRYTRRRARNQPEGNLQSPNMDLAELNGESEEGNIIASGLKIGSGVPSKVEEITGLNYEQFCRSVVLAQGEFAAFLNAEAKKRGELLEQITGTQIYGDLSRAAHIKARQIEKAKLDELDLKLEALSLLNDVEIKELKNELKNIKKQSEGVKKERDEIRIQLDWLSKTEILKSQKKEIEDAMAGLEKRKKERASEFEKLVLYEKAEPFKEDMTLLSNFFQSEKELESEREKLAEKAKSLKERSSAHEEQFRVLKAELSELNKEFSEKEKLFRRVEKLDIEIGQKEGMVSEKKEGLDEQEKARKEGRAKDEKRKKEEIELREKLQKLDSGLALNAPLAGLEKDMSPIERFSDQMEKSRAGFQKLESDLKNCEENYEKLNREYDQKKSDIEKTGSEWEKLTRQFDNLAPEPYTFSRSELLEKIQTEIEQLGEGTQKLGKLKEWSDRYDRLMAEIIARREEVENMARQSDFVDMELLSLRQREDELREQSEYRRAIYEQQLKIKNYEEDRHKLKEGEPCPLCGSTHHPFCQKGKWKPFVTEAEKDYERVKKDLDKVLSQTKELVNRSRDLHATIERFYGKNGKGGELQGLENQLVEIENQMGSLAPDFEFGEFSLTRKGNLSGLITRVENQLVERRAARTSLTRLNLKIETEEKTLHTLKTQIGELEIHRQTRKTQLNHLKERREEFGREFEKAKTELDTLLKRYGVAMKPGSVEALKKDFEKFKLDKEEKHTLSTRLEILKTELEQSAENLENLAAGIQKQKQKLDKESAELETLKTKRTSLFGDGGPAKEREKWNRNLKEKEAKASRVNEEREGLKSESKVAESGFKVKEKELIKVRQNIEKLSEKLEKASRKEGFDNLDHLGSVLLKPDELKAIREKEKELNELIIKTKDRLESTTKKLEKEQKKALTELPKDALTLSFKKAEGDYQTLQQKIGGIKTRLTENDKRKENQKALLEERDRQNREYLRWEKLRSVIGSHDGKEYRSFAQGLTLQQLVYLANRHLAKLSGRYVIRKEPQKDLDLQIVDTYQADNVRSMNTLSGGESFLVSLALALGLSDLAGRNTNIRSLFIDEGFGTLDEATLDEAISTLDNLQASGKTIGVISHVKELKERISTQIRVVRKSGGFSEIEIVG